MVDTAVTADSCEDASTRASMLGSVVLVGRMVVATSLNYLLSLLLAWLVVPTEFGRIAIMQTTLLVGALALNSGFPWTLAWQVARTEKYGSESVERAFRTSLIGNLALGFLISAIVVLLGLEDVIWPTRSSLGLLLLVACCFPLFAINSVMRGALQGARRFGAIAVFQTAEVVVKFAVVVVTVVWLGAGASGVAIGFFVGAAVSAAVGGYLAADLLPRRGPVAPIGFVLETVPMFVGSVGLALLVTIDILSLRKLGGIPAAGIAVYQVAAIVARVPYFVADALTDVAFPFIVRARASREASHRRFQDSAARIVVFVVPLELLLIIRPQPLLTLAFPGHYASALPLIRLLALGGIGCVAANAFGKALQALGERRAAALGIMIGLAVEIAALIVLVRSSGTRGAAIAFACGAWSAALILGLWYVTAQRPLRPSMSSVRTVAPLVVLTTVLLLPLGQSLTVEIAQVAAAGVAYLLAFVLSNKGGRLKRAIRTFDGRATPSTIRK